VPNLPPYQLATGKNGNPLAVGKPFVNNFLPNGGDMLRLNMAVPITPRNDPKFSTLGLIQAAVLGLTDTAYNTSSELEFIPNMDGFPNGRRLEDDVTRIELQAVSGIVLAAIGLWYDDYIPNVTPTPVTPKLLNVYTYTTGVESNDVDYQSIFPFVAEPHRGTDECGGPVFVGTKDVFGGTIGLTQKPVLMKNFPNPFTTQTTFQFKVNTPMNITVRVYDMRGAYVATPYTGFVAEGEFQQVWNSGTTPPGIYMANLYDAAGHLLQSGKMVKTQ